MKCTEKQLEPRKLIAKRVSPHPFSPIVTLSRTAQAPFHPPPPRLQPPVAAAAAAPAPLPLPLPQPWDPCSPTHPFPSVPSPSPCRLGTDSPPCVSAWYVPRYGLRLRSPLPGPPKSQGASFKCCRSSFCLGGLWVAVSRGQAQWVAPPMIIHFHSHPSILGVQGWVPGHSCNWGSGEEGAKGERTTAPPSLLIYPMP